MNEGNVPLGQKLQSIPREWLFLLLILCATIPLFVKFELPDAPTDASFDFFENLMALKRGDKVLIASDWTTSTRAESGGETEALLKILIRKGVKIVMYSSGDPQAPQVFRDTIAEVAKEEHDLGRPEYKPWDDYVVAGYFPNGEGTALGINNNVKATFSGRKDAPPGGAAQDILQSPVFEGINSVSDFKFLLMITASNTERITFERVKKTPLMFMVTGVMVPEDQVYYASGQLKGLVGGVAGVFDLEMLMDKGVNTPNGYKDPRHSAAVEGFPKATNNKGRGTSYFLALHACLALLIIAVLVGNVGVWMTKRSSKQS